MYYSETERLNKIESYLEKLAYGSVALDFMVAVGSFLLLHRVGYAKFIIEVSNYAITAEIVIAAVLFLALIAMKHYKRVILNFDMETFRMKHKKSSLYAGMERKKEMENFRTQNKA
ncbi:hypothetical protein M1567_01460 [Candidatus Marsarchaeota archaeon]|nr:hypothetical protein [Candidatus Marsarchaeota archaeon]